MDIRKRLINVDALPVMPQMAERLMRLRSDQSPVDALVEVVELDPSLAAQVIRYARSPLYSYTGDVATVKDAVARVLGFDSVYNMALGIALGGELKIPLDGRIGLKALWRHSVYSAGLAQYLARRMPVKRRPPLGAVYLAALLQQIGVLLLGHVCRTEFHLLNKVISAHPEKELTEIEQLLLGMTHPQIGANLMRAWQMPESVVTAIEEHHNFDYTGEHAVYVHLIQLSNHLLAGQALSDTVDVDLPADLLAALGLDQGAAEESLETLLDAAPELDIMVRYMAA